jgi:hypothetical protein
MKLSVELLDTRTNRRVTYPYDHGKHPWDDFMWVEGNYACDCNRALFFARGSGVEVPRNPPCGTGRYRLRITGEAGEVLLDEITEGKPS